MVLVKKVVEPIEGSATIEKNGITGVESLALKFKKLAPCIVYCVIQDVVATMFSPSQRTHPLKY